MLGLLPVIFCIFVPELWPLIYIKISFPLNLENKLTEFHQSLYMNSYCQDLSWDLNTSFLAHLYESYGPLYMP